MDIDIIKIQLLVSRYGSFVDIEYPESDTNK